MNLWGLAGHRLLLELAIGEESGPAAYELLFDNYDGTAGVVTGCCLLYLLSNRLSTTKPD